MELSPTYVDADADVLIVGAGPVGMTAALLLARRGSSVIVLEQHGGPSAEPKAISLDDESLRTYQSAGAVDRVLSIVVPGTGTRYYGADDVELFHASGPEPYRLGHPFKNPFAQPDLEQVLRRLLLDEALVDLRYGSRVTGVTNRGDAVTVDVRSAEGASTAVRGRFLIGADGGRSSVREALGITMSGRSDEAAWLVVDTLEDWHDERYGMHHGDPDRPHVIVPGLNGRCRYEFLLHPGEGGAGDTPPLDLMRRLVAPYRPLDAGQIERAVIYRFNALNTDEWSRGRAFLVGDAAHMMPPFAGQGLNSGIRDVANLTWKLAAVCAGHLAIDWLVSYETERRDHVAATIRLSENLGRFVMTTSRELAERRDRVIRCALETPDGRRYFEQMQYRPRVRATDGLVVPNGSDVVGTTIAQPRVFDTRTHKPRMLDDVIGDGWAVIGVGVSRDGWNDASAVVNPTRAIRLHVPVGDHLPSTLGGAIVLLDLDGGLNREFQERAGTFLLVRPDRMIAAEWPAGRSAEVATTVAGWFDQAEITGPGRRTNRSDREGDVNAITAYSAAAK
ncbi:FAD-dependent oxidoreductase [uncultured Amnibacterium sp.]|uniref:FAD-dependent oxidoreductase n=1 Tax=uncultured Amnibacterium sp. TaxID=1631851 RepID=UPI0035CBD9F6